MTLPVQFRPLPVRLSVIVLLAFSIVLTQVPLFNYLGYEFSAAVALAISILSGVATIGLFRLQYGLQSTVAPEDLRRFQTATISFHSFLLLLPLLVVTLNAAVVRNCSYLEGLGFYLLIPCVTALFSHSLAGLCAVLFRRPRIAYLAVVFLILGHILWLGYFTPQIFAYNFILGYFPGLSYDEVLTITPTLVLFRGVTLAAAGFLFLLTRLVVTECRLTDGIGVKIRSIVGSFGRPWRRDHAVLISLIVPVALVWIFRTDFGLESSNFEIEKRLSGNFQTEHFRIHYRPDSFADDEIRWAGAEHEFRLQQIAQRLQVFSGGRIDSYIYPTAEVKREYIGTGTTNIAKPWRREVHLNKDSWRQTLKHELVHVLAGEFGVPVIRANYNVGLVEGVAMAVEWDFGNRTLHEYAAAMESFGFMKDVTKLLTLEGFALQASSVSYVLSGSFCRFLIDRYGLVRFKELYGGRSFSAVYGKDAELLAGEWHDFLSRFSVPGNWEQHVQFFFGRKSIFAKECARHVAGLNERAGRELSRGNPVEAMRLYGNALRESRNSESFGGLVRAGYASARYDTVVTLIDRQLAQNHSALGNLMILYGDALWAREDLLSARRAYQTALELDLSESFNEAASLRLSVLDDSKLSRGLEKVFVGFEPDSVRRAILEKAGSKHIAAAMLLAQVLFRMERYGEASNVLDRPASGVADSVVNLARHRLRGVCAFRLRRFQEARVHFWEAMNFTFNEASRVRLNDWIDRCEWFDVYARQYLDSRK